MPQALATFRDTDGGDPSLSIHKTIEGLTTVTVGDLLLVGQVYRSRIRERTFRGIDVNGAPFVPYSTKGPYYYFYPNREVASGKTPEGRKARQTASRNRFAKTGSIGVRTTTGIKYESYAAAKAAHGAATVNLYGMEQHTHMLDTMLVKAGGSEVDLTGGGMDLGSEFSAFEQNVACSQLTLGFYGPEAERAKGQNEGNSKTPQREFFALNAEDLQIGERAVADRMRYRAGNPQGGGGTQGGLSTPPAAGSSGGLDRSDWISF